MKINLYALLILLTSCTSIPFIGSLEPVKEELKYNESLVCSLNKKKFLGVNRPHQKAFKKILKSISENNIKLNFFDQTTLWNLFQINVRPEVVGPNSRLLLLTLKRNLLSYHDFNNIYPDQKNRTYPFLDGLQFNQKEHGTKSLKELILMIEKYSPKRMPIDHRFMAYLQKNKDIIKNKKFLKARYFRGETPLRKGETFTRNSYQYLIGKIAKYKKSKMVNLFEFKAAQSEKEAFCNQDLNLYNNAIFEPTFTSNTIVHPLLATDGNNVVISLISNEANIDKSNDYSFHYQSPQGAVPFCVGSSQNIFPSLLLSLKERDPAQQLYNLLNYQINDKTQLFDFKSIIDFSRHQILTTPPRMHFESKRSSKKHLEEFLQLDLPIYHQNSIGSIWGVFGRDKKQLIIDGREQTSEFTCGR